VTAAADAGDPTGASAFWCERAWVDGAVHDGVLLRADEAGMLTEVRVGITAAEAAAESDSGAAGADAPLEHLTGIVFPGGVNAHSHAFHRMLRGRTHADGGTFWTWREVMYDVAGRLTPESYRVVARAVFAEMLAGGWTSVGEFHYLHHAPGGAPYGHDDAVEGSHAMELALVAAAEDAGIRMRLIDTCYLTGAIGEELSEEQARFGDGDIDGYLRRHSSLARALDARTPPRADLPDSPSLRPSPYHPLSRGTGHRSEGRAHTGVPRTAGPPLAGQGASLAGSGASLAGQGASRSGHGAALAGQVAPLVTLGAAIHSVRAVPASDIGRFRDLGGPVHIHLSEQPAENGASRAAYGRTPTGVLDGAGLLSPALSPVHATHLTAEDIAALGAAGTTIVMCPTTEADLADGIGPALDLAHAGATIALGSDQHVVLDALRELQGLEAGERLRSGQRGRFTPTQLIDAMTVGGARSLDLPVGALEVGRACDLIAVDRASPRTYGSVGEQVVLAGTSADVRTVVTAGRVRVRDGRHTRLGDVSALYREAYEALGWDT